MKKTQRLLNGNLILTIIFCAFNFISQAQIPDKEVTVDFKNKKQWKAHGNDIRGIEENGKLTLTIAKSKFEDHYVVFNPWENQFTNNNNVYGSCNVKFDFNTIKTDATTGVGIYLGPVTSFILFKDGKLKVRSEHDSVLDVSRSYKPNQLNTVSITKNYETWNYVLNGDTVYKAKESKSQELKESSYFIGLGFTCHYSHDEQIIEISNVSMQFFIDQRLLVKKSAAEANEIARAKAKADALAAVLALNLPFYHFSGLYKMISNCGNKMKDFALTVKASGGDRYDSPAYLQLVDIGEGDYQNQKGVQVYMEKSDDGSYYHCKQSEREDRFIGRTGSKSDFGLHCKIGNDEWYLQNIRITAFGVLSFEMHYETEGKDELNNGASYQTHTYKSLNCTFSGKN